MRLEPYMTSRFIFSSIALFVFTLSIKACSNADEQSATASVDNFANGDSSKFTLNSCGIDQGAPANDLTLADAEAKLKAKVIDPVMFEKYKADLLAVLQATPKFIYEPFFATDAKIDLSDEHQTECDKYPKEKGVDSSFACYDDKSLYFGAGSRNAGSITPVNTKEAIRHSFLRGMAYRSYEPLLKQGTIIPDALKPLFSAQPGSIYEAMVVAFKKDIKKDSLNGITEDQLRVFLYLESLDSLYCSAQSKSNLQKQFPELYLVVTNFKASQAPSN